jgi:molybdate transport system substrate-binding protein
MAGHSQITIKFAFGSSTTLAAQIAAGASADIFASADTSSMSTVASQFPTAVNYVANQVVLALPKNSSITKLSELNGKVTWLQCGHTVPCGIAADSALKSEGVITSSPVSLEATASSATAKLLAGAVDAAILFKTDVVANPTKLKYIPFTNSAAASSQYQIGLSVAKATAKNVWARTVYLYLSGLTAKKFLLASGFIA